MGFISVFVHFLLLMILDYRAITEDLRKNAPEAAGLKKLRTFIQPNNISEVIFPFSAALWFYSTNI